MKNNRQEKILAIIEAEPIETQEQLLAKLQEQGIESTQATISRDIDEVNLLALRQRLECMLHQVTTRTR